VSLDSGFLFEAIPAFRCNLFYCFTPLSVIKGFVKNNKKGFPLQSGLKIAMAIAMAIAKINGKNQLEILNSKLLTQSYSLQTKNYFFPISIISNP
jgi:hypothetical protein